MINKETLDSIVHYNRINVMHTLDLERRVVNAPRRDKVPPEDVEMGKYILSERHRAKYVEVRATIESDEDTSAEAKSRLLAELDKAPWLEPILTRLKGSADLDKPGLVSLTFRPMAYSYWGKFGPPKQDPSGLPGYIPMPKAKEMQAITKRIAEAQIGFLDEGFVNNRDIDGAGPTVSDKELARRKADVHFGIALWAQVVDFIGKMTAEDHAKLGDFIKKEIYWRGQTPKEAVWTISSTITGALEGYPNVDAEVSKQIGLATLGLCDYPPGSWGV